jgi:hypothetical protein
VLAGEQRAPAFSGRHGGNNQDVSQMECCTK